MKQPSKSDNQVGVRHGSGNEDQTEEEIKKQKEIEDAITKGGRDIPRKSPSGN
ncbi:MAG: hypothetical protein ACSHXB_08960 [Sulfitobacter sp.]